MNQERKYLAQAAQIPHKEAVAQNQEEVEPFQECQPARAVVQCLELVDPLPA